MKCNTCKVQKMVNESIEPSCCVWFMDHVVIGDESIDQCPDYEPIEKGETK